MLLITNFSENSFSSRSALSSARATRSSPPPGLPAGTISIVLDGNSAAYAELVAQARPAAARTNSCIRFMRYSIKFAWMSRGGYYQDPIQPACGARYAVALRVVSDSPNAWDLDQDDSLRRRAGAF